MEREGTESVGVVLRVRDGRLIRTEDYHLRSTLEDDRATFFERFVAEALLEGDFEEALQLTVASPAREDRSRTKRRRRALRQAARGLPRFVEIVYRHGVESDEDYRMVGGLENFLRVSTEELKTFARLTGNDDVHKLAIGDLSTTNSEISNHTDIEHV